MPKTSLFDELVDQYKLEKYLGQNSVTDMYEAFDVDENRTVIVEILLPHLSQHKAYRQRFAQKLRRVTQLKHPHIAQVLQVGDTPTRGRPYFAREKVESYPLRERMQLLFAQSTPVNSIYALKLVRQLAESLALAERLEIFHHDLQPDKVLLKSDGTVVLTDLGIPQIQESVKNGHPFQLNPRYWSPEQAQEKEMTARSHVYSMGVILFELLTGTLPEAPTTFWQTVKSSPLPSGKTELEKLRTDLSTETYNLVRRMLLPPPWARFQNSNELIEAIDEAIKAEEYLVQAGAAVRGGAFGDLWVKVAVPLTLILIASIVGLVLLLRGRGDDQTPAVAQATSNSVGVGQSDATATDEQPTSTPTIAMSASAPAPTDTAVSNASITQTNPVDGQQFGAEDIIQFQWTWPVGLTANESFIIQISDGNQEYILREVNLPVSGENYSASVSSIDFPNGSGSYQWQVVLTENGIPVQQSQQRRIDVTVPATRTPTPTELLTPTPEPSSTSQPSPTPLPAVRVIVSSASLREGPGLNYDVIMYLQEGDVVTVIGVNRTDGNWYNVFTQGGILGWLAISVAGPANDSDLTAVPTAATIPPSPTPTNTPTPTPTLTPSPVPTTSGGGGGGQPQPPQPATKTPPPPP